MLLFNEVCTYGDRYIWAQTICSLMQFLVFDTYSKCGPLNLINDHTSTTKSTELLISNDTDLLHIRRRRERIKTNESFWIDWYSIIRLSNRTLSMSNELRISTLHRKWDLFIWVKCKDLLKIWSIHRKGI